MSKYAALLEFIKEQPKAKRILMSATPIWHPVDELLWHSAARLPIISPIYQRFRTETNQIFGKIGIKIKNCIVPNTIVVADTTYNIETNTMMSGQIALTKTRAEIIELFGNICAEFTEKCVALRQLPLPIANEIANNLLPSFRYLG